ncbi:phosphoserine aminotransferase [Schizophyllum commune Loenen D]|nr:phosphoserine aminotransferase [Schizophyllum commune Loenen D]
MSAEARAINFGAGPSALPQSVLEETAKGLLNFEGTGIGIAEISHRSKEFTAYVRNLENLIREQLEVPPTHHIIFTQGGGTGQFSAVVLNMLARHRLLHPELTDEERALDYVITGSWSKKACEEAKRLGGGRVNVVADGRKHSADGKSFKSIPPPDAYTFSENPALIYYCENETVDGVQFAHTPGPTAFPYDRLPKNALVPLVADYSSSFMSRPIPRLADHAIIYAGAQKNIGPAGLTILIVRQDCVVDVDAAAKLGAVPTPITMSYKTLVESGSLYNTPSVLPLYMTGLVVQRMKQLGGLSYFEQTNKTKAEKVYAVLKEGEAKGKLRGKVQEGSGSWMNVVFDVLGEGEEAKFLAGAEARNLKGLKGHRSVGGIRASLYNAVTEEDTDKLVDYIKEFIA